MQWFGLSLMRGKLDWTLLRCLTVLDKDIGNHDCERCMLLMPALRAGGVPLARGLGSAADACEAVCAFRFM